MYNPQLDTFLRVADEGSFNKAAEKAVKDWTTKFTKYNLFRGIKNEQLYLRK